jgi:hypothetical protein
VDEAEGIGGEGEERIDKAELVQSVGPGLPEAGHGVVVRILRCAGEDRDDELERCGVNPCTLGLVENANSLIPMNGGVLFQR